MKCKKNYHYDGLWYFNGSTRIFRVIGDDDTLITTLWISRFNLKTGIATIDVPAGTNIYELSNIISDCLNPDSNFESELMKSYKVDSEAIQLNGIKFEYNGTTVLVDKHLSSVNDILYAWRKRKVMSRKDKKANISVIDHIDKTTSMKFIDNDGKQEWKNFVKIHSNNSYSLATVNFARRLAKYLQVYISNGNDINHIDYSLISLFNFEENLDLPMINYAMTVLSECWLYGKALRNYWFRY